MKSVFLLQPDNIYKNPEKQENHDSTQHNVIVTETVADIHNKVHLKKVNPKEYL